MWARLCVLGAVASCYSPHALPGAPCAPALANCPEPQACLLVAGSYVCVEGLPADAATGVGVDGSPRDAPLLVDARIDAQMAAPIDAPIDAAAPTRWTLVQISSSQTATTTMAASGTGNLIVVAVETANVGAVTSVTDNANNTYVAVPSSRSINTSGTFGVELWYAKNAHPGATSITASAATVYALTAWEVSGISTTSPVDTASILSDRSASSTPLGASITTSVAGEFVVSVVVVVNTIAGIHAGNAFTNDQLTFGNGWAHLTDPAAAAGSHQAQWDQPMSGGYCSSSAAFRVGP